MKMQKNWMSKVLLLAVAVLLNAGNIQAQQTQETLTLTLDRALEIALSENPTMKVANEEIALKKVSYKEAWQNLLPQANLSGALNYTILVAEMDLGSMGKIKMGRDDSKAVQAGVTVSLPVFAPSVYKAMSLSKTDIELAVEKSRSSKLDLVNQVTKAYYQLMLTQDSYEVLQKSYKVAEDNFNVVKAKYEQGKVSEYDKISADVQLRSIKPNLISTANAVEITKLQLKVLMGVTADVNIAIDDNLKNYENNLFANELEPELNTLANSSTMKQLDLNMKMLQQNRKLLLANFMPTVGAQFSYQYQSIGNLNWNMFKYSYSPSSSLAISVSLPLYKASNFTKMKSNTIQMRQLTQTRIDTERKLNMQVESYRNSMQASSEQVASNKENVMQAEKAVTIAGKRYEVGKGTVLELNSSQVQLTQAELTYNQSIYDYLVAKADLDKVLGNE